MIVAPLPLLLLALAASAEAAPSLPTLELSPEESLVLESLVGGELLNSTDLASLLAQRSVHPHANLNVTQVIELYNYTHEEHEVVSDGYILEVQRITGGPSSPSREGKPVVLLMHGILCSSMDWVLAGPERGLGFLLADAGYDVWMGNARGNRYCRRHESMTDLDSKYWRFSWHEIGMSDVPAMIDYALARTGREKLFYVGHSQGSTAFYVMTSERPEYNDKVEAMFSLAPVAYCSKMFSPFFRLISRLTNVIELVAEIVGVDEFKPTNSFFKKFTSKFCQDNSIIQPVCMNALFIIVGFNKNQLETSLLPAMLAHVPAGASVQQFVHYGQMINSGKFRKFSYGWLENWRRYRRFTPPSYDLKNIRAPVYLHYSVNDWLSNPQDVQRLYEELPNAQGRFRVPDDKFNHIDFLWAKDVKTLLYDKIINLMARHEN